MEIIKSVVTTGDYYSKVLFAFLLERDTFSLILRRKFFLYLRIPNALNPTVFLMPVLH